MSYRVRNILIAAALAVAALLMTMIYVNSYKKRVDAQQAGRKVLVATADIPAGTSAAKAIANHLVAPKEVAQKLVVPGAISSANQINGLIVNQPIYAGEQVTTRRFGSLARAGIRGQLQGSDRAVQLAGDPNQTLNGTIHAGDYVDFVGVVKVQNSGDALTFSRVFVRNLKVLRVNNGTMGKVANPGSGSSNTVMLRMTDAESQKVGVVYKDGDYWFLALRPTRGATDSPNSVETPQSLFADGVDASKLAGLLTIPGGAKQ